MSPRDERQDASENPMRAVAVEKIVFGLFVGESGDRCPRTYRGEERFPDMTITFALIQTIEKLAERSSPKLV